MSLNKYAKIPLSALNKYTIFVRKSCCSAVKSLSGKMCEFVNFYKNVQTEWNINVLWVLCLLMINNVKLCRFLGFQIKSKFNQTTFALRYSDMLVLYEDFKL